MLIVPVTSNSAAGEIFLIPTLLLAKSTNNVLVFTVRAPLIATSPITSKSTVGEGLFMPTFPAFFTNKTFVEFSSPVISADPDTVSEEAGEVVFIPTLFEEVSTNNTPESILKLFETVKEELITATPITFKVELNVVAPATPRVELKVVAPVT
jgi:hypothetical protein